MYHITKTSRQNNMNLHKLTTLHLKAFSLILSTCASISSAAFLPPQHQSMTNKGITFFHPRHNMHTALHSLTDRDGEFGYFDEESDYEDDFDFENELTQNDKKRMAKAYFEEAFDYNDGDRIKPEEVHIILFNPNNEREGVHTVNFRGDDIILAFESRLECLEFSLKLREQNFFEPVPQEINLESLEEYCDSISTNVQVVVVPKGSHLKPPTKKLDNLGLNPDLEKEMKLLDYLYEMSDSAPEDNQLNDEIAGAWE